MFAKGNNDLYQSTADADPTLLPVRLVDRWSKMTTERKSDNIKKEMPLKKRKNKAK